MAGKPIALAKQRASTVRPQENSEHQALQSLTKEVAGDLEVETEKGGGDNPENSDKEEVEELDSLADGERFYCDRIVIPAIFAFIVVKE